MNDPPINALQLPDEIAIGVGRIVAGYSHIEYLVYIVYAALCGDDPHSLFSRLYKLRSINNKLHEIDKVANESMDKTLLNAWDIIKSRFKSAAKKRTRVTHTQFLQRPDGIYGIEITKKGPKLYLISDRYFKETLNQYRTLAFDLAVFQGLLFELNRTCIR